MFFLKQINMPESVYPFDLRDRGLLLADGVFDTSLIVHGTMILCAEHLRRLVRDAAALDILLDGQKIKALLDQALTENHHGALRITVTSGPSERGVFRRQAKAPTILLSLTPLDKSYQFTSISLQTSCIRRNSTSPASRHKTLAYVDHVVAHRDARTSGYDDALFLNERGNVCCTTVGNLFLKIGDIWMTPPISDGVLPGVMRQWVICHAPAISLQITERSIHESQLQLVESAFMVNSVQLAVPISKINTHRLRPQLPVGLKSAVMTLIGAFKEC